MHTTFCWMVLKFFSSIVFIFIKKYNNKFGLRVTGEGERDYKFKFFQYL